MLKIRRDQGNIVFILYTILFFLSLYDNRNRNLYYLLIIGINIVITLKNRSDVTVPLLCSFILGNEVYSIINIFCVLLLAKNEIDKKLTKKLFFGFCVIGALSLLNAISNNTYINVVISMLYLFIVCFIIVRTKKMFKGDYCNVIKKFVVVEMFITFYLILIFKNLSPGDIHFGTLNNAHVFGNWCIVNLFVLYNANGNLSKLLKNNLLTVLMLIFMLYLSDSKTLVMCFLIVIFLSYILNKKLMKKNGVKYFIIGIYGGIYILCGLIYNPVVENFITTNFSSYSNYIYNASWNYKFYYIRGTLKDELKGMNLITGYGLGQYGSRFANLFAYDVMARNDSTINQIVESNFSPHHIDNYTKYIMFYTDAFVETIPYKSAILTYPFSSLIAIIAETGLVGVILMTVFLNNLFKQSNLKYLLFYFVTICLFDTFFDMILVVGYVMVWMMNGSEFHDEKENLVLEEV